MCWCFGLILANFQLAMGAGSSQPLESLTPKAAEKIVAARMVAKSDKEAARRARIAAVPAIEEWEAQVGGRSVFMREIAPPVIPLPIAVNKAAALKKPGLAHFSALEYFRSQEFRQLSLSATVYDRALTKITWRNEKGQPFTVWCNVDFNYLSGIGRLYTETLDSVLKAETRQSKIHYVHWSSLIFVLNVDSEKERENKQRMAQRAAELGFEYTAQVLPEFPQFDSKQIEYIVLDDPDFPAPKALYEEMDFILEYYRDHEAALKVAFQRREALSAAYTAWEKANPPPAPKDVIVNFWKIR